MTCSIRQLSTRDEVPCYRCLYIVRHVRPRVPARQHPPRERPTRLGQATAPHCMACINCCPKEAIEYGKHSVGLRALHLQTSILCIEGQEVQSYIDMTVHTCLCATIGNRNALREGISPIALPQRVPCACEDWA